MKVYIAGPITGHPDYREKFKAAEEFLKSKGCTPVSPVADEEEEHDYKWYIDRGLGLLKECDAIYLLEGWQDSKGARLEAIYADITGLGIGVE